MLRDRRGQRRNAVVRDEFEGFALIRHLMENSRSHYEAKKRFQAFSKAWLDISAHPDEGQFMEIVNFNVFFGCERMLFRQRQQ